jgi:hypothetical protein
LSLISKSLKIFFLQLKFYIKLAKSFSKFKIYKIEKINFKKNSKILKKKQKINFIKPKFISKPTDKIQYKIHKEFPDIKIKIIDDVKVFGQSNLIFKNNEVYYSNNLWDPKNNFCLEEMSGKCLISKRKKLFWPNPKKKIEIKEAVSFLDSASFNYAHWTLEILPKIFLFSKFNKNKKIILLVDKNLHKNQYQALKLVINKNQIVRYINKNECVHVQKLHTLSSVGYSYHSPLHPEKKHFHGIYSHSLLKDFSNYIIKKTNSKIKNKKFEKIFITRQSKKRNLINQKQISEILKLKKFKIICINDLNFIEQVNLYNKAKMIIGPVSASNANLIFSNSNLKYFCLLNDNEDGDGYYFWPSVISFRNIHINFLVGKKIGFRGNTQGNFNIENNKISKLLKIID